MNKRWTMLLAYSLLSSSIAVADNAKLVIEGAWVRALPPTQKVTAAYLKLTNEGPEVVNIIGGNTELAAEVQIHTTREIDGYMRMEQLPELQIPPGDSVSLEPGGTHLMLMELERMPTPGEAVRLCLDLASGESVCADAIVKKSANAEVKNEHHHH